MALPASSNSVAHTEMPWAVCGNRRGAGGATAVAGPSQPHTRRYRRRRMCRVSPACRHAVCAATVISIRSDSTNPGAAYARPHCLQHRSTADSSRTSARTASAGRGVRPGPGRPGPPGRPNHRVAVRAAVARRRAPVARCDRRNGAGSIRIVRTHRLQRTQLLLQRRNGRL